MLDAGWFSGSFFSQDHSLCEVDLVTGGGGAPGGDDIIYHWIHFCWTTTVSVTYLLKLCDSADSAESGILVADSEHMIIVNIQPKYWSCLICLGCKFCPENWKTCGQSFVVLWEGDGFIMENVRLVIITCL